MKRALAALGLATWGGWRPGEVVSWTLDELRKDPAVEKQEVFFED